MQNKKFYLCTWLFIMLFTGVAGCSQQSQMPINRYVINSWEPEIGYSAVVSVGNTYYISGVACDGENYTKAVEACYKTINNILQKLALTPQQIVKENIYTRDIEAVKQQIPIRKAFYGNGPYPAATWVQIERLFSPTQLLEIELIAIKTK